MLAARDAMPEVARSEASRRITEQVTSLDAYRAAGSLLAYLSFGTEFDTAALIADALESGKRLYLPRVNRETKQLDVHEVRDLASDLAAGTWGIREPRPEVCPLADPGAIDFVLLPGVAFTVNGRRLGYGAGFYDRLIPRLASRPPLVAAAFEAQVVDDIPVASHDRSADLVVTEANAYLAC